MKYTINNDRDALAALDDLEVHFCKASNNTLSEYYKIGQRLISRKTGSETVIDVLLKAKSKNTFYTWINGFRFYVWRAIRENLVLYEAFSEQDIHDKLCELFNDLQEVANFNTSSYEFNFNKKKFKKLALKGLPTNWREQIISYNPNSKYQLALITIALTGCRPCELEKGIKISISDNRIHFFIEGAKVDEKKGQPHRTISYSLISGNPIIEHLINGPLSAKEDITVSIEKAVNFSVEVRRISKILWPHHKESITCYCFRHQFSSDMKKSKMGDDISRALGHATDKTRKGYGHASQGRGPVTDVVVTAPRPIKSVTLNSSENSPSFT